MSREQTNGEFDLSQFEKNRFFQGKLMTAQDMETEQEYHSKRLHTLTRFTTGEGILHGLAVSSIEEDGDELKVTVEPGIALDGLGRPIIVEHTTTKTLPAPSGDEIYLYLRYSEVSMESVPVPDADGASRDKHSSNRAVEVFELSYQETPPERSTTIPHIENPVAKADDADADIDRERVQHEIANAFHERHRSGDQSADDPSIFVGAFERTPVGDWIESDETVRRPLVYDNDMLYAMLVQHITDTDNPHQTPTQSKPEELAAELDDIESFSQKLQVLQKEINELKRKQDTLNHFVMRKSLKDRARFFVNLSVQFENQNGEASRIAREIAEKAERGVNRGNFETVEQYQAFIRELLELDLDLGETLEASATEESLDRYVRAVTRLQAALEEESDILEVAVAQDKVCEAADSIETLYDVVPNE